YAKAALLRKLMASAISTIVNRIMEPPAAPAFINVVLGAEGAVDGVIGGGTTAAIACQPESPVMAAGFNRGFEVARPVQLLRRDRADAGQVVGIAGLAGGIPAIDGQPVRGKR